LDALAAGEIDRVAGVKAPEPLRDVRQCVDHRELVAQPGPQGAAQPAGEPTVLAAEQESGPHGGPSVTVDGHRQLDVIDERREVGRLGRIEGDGRNVPAQVRWLAHDVERRRCPVGRRDSDVVRPPLEVAAVEGEQPEAATKLALLLDTREGE
jgi:hypothetical protein